MTATNATTSIPILFTCPDTGDSLNLLCRLSFHGIVNARLKFTACDTIRRVSVPTVLAFREEFGVIIGKFLNQLIESAIDSLIAESPAL